MSENSSSACSILPKASCTCLAIFYPSSKEHKDSGRKNHFSAAFQSRNFMQFYIAINGKVQLTYQSGKLITPFYAQQNQVRLMGMSTVLLLKMKSLIERCFAFQQPLNLQFIDLIVFKEDLRQFIDLIVFKEGLLLPRQASNKNQVKCFCNS